MPPQIVARDLAKSFRVAERAPGSMRGLAFTYGGNYASQYPMDIYARRSR
jgi:hypothetical protein